MNVVVHSSESLVFRDGRPFGDDGHVNGGALRWPHSFTVTGLLRNRVGMSRRPDYFKGAQRDRDIAAIKKVQAVRILPLWRAFADGSSWHPLFPAPADAMVFPGERENHYRIFPFDYENSFARGGVNLPWKNWLLPVSSRREKPARDFPELWHEKPFFTWLEKGILSDPLDAGELGFNLPRPELRLHTAIDPFSGSAKNGQLFSSQGIRLMTAANQYKSAGRFGIGVSLGQLDPGDDPTGPCFFGGERKTAHVDEIEDFMPAVPDWFSGGSRYLRLVLISPGDFGSWIPDWLRPADNEAETPWCTIPTSDLEIRLVSAFVPRWQPVSGWDYDRGGPKATRKLVPAGAVYVIELKEPLKAAAVAELLWGRSLNDNLFDAGGCGCVCVGNFHS